MANDPQPGRASTELDSVAERWIDTQLELFPEFHVYLGRPGREGEYSDYSPEGAERAVAATRAALAEVEAAPVVDEVDRVTQLDLSRELTLAIEKHEAGFPLRDLNVIASPPQDLRAIFDLEPTATSENWEGIARRLRNLPAAVDGYVATLREGVRTGVVPAIRQVREVAAQVREHAAADGFFAQFAGSASAGGAELPSALRTELTGAATGASAAYGRLAEFLEQELAPAAPEKDAVGRELYALASRDFLGATVDLDETYEWGIEELARMVAEQESIAAEIVAGGGVAEAIAFLDADPASKLHGTEALQRWMQETSDRAIEELGRTHFDIAPEMRALECRIAPTQEGGIYYTGPSDDFSRPGRMWWSVPEGVTEFDTWRELTTVYHEGVPGHHLQIAQATFNKAELNTWRRFAGTSGHAEGWALYAERLMADLGYLDAPADRFGMLDGQRMRAARVVLDIGVHLEKRMPGSDRVWTGDDAFPFLRANVNMPDEFVRFETNRYLGWPGQAPSYKVGQRIWEQLRDEYRRREGAAFDMKRLHTRALNIGGVGLDTLKSALLD
ncbi:DUF885 domain-containing protein [Schumannella soli]|uniref:DUF885 domain-containing protein n=1 Tax=Schumannella soli TaxID=2590779 RepID=A0A506Y3W9_9MICO|nr:DUF885 domain-containing protein [Schumannella soli]TPW76290.1 DUF885 domain-containing protein [Schumannella soli]